MGLIWPKHLEFVISILKLDFYVQNNPNSGFSSIIYLIYRWDKHTNTICCKANCTLGFLRRNLKIGSKAIKERAYKTLVRPQVEYAAAVWDPHTDREIKAIQAVQRRAARFCLGRYRRTSHVSDMLEELQWPTLKSRRKASGLTMLFKIVNGLVKISAQSLKAPLRRSRHHHSKTFQLVQSRTNYRKFSFVICLTYL